MGPVITPNRPLRPAQPLGLRNRVPTLGAGGQTVLLRREAGLEVWEERNLTLP